MPKSPDAFRTISEVADWLETPAHVLRFWESKFTQVKPVKRAGGRRYYRPADMELLGGIKRLLHQDGITIKDVQKLLREKGAKHVAGLSQPINENDTIEAATADYIEAASPEEPVFASIAPKKIAEPADPEDNDDQMSFPGFSFASERTEAAPAADAEYAPSKDALQGIDITHISDLDATVGDETETGLLGLLAQLPMGGLAKNSDSIESLGRSLAAIAADAKS